MAFNAGTGWEARTSAADANGGGGFSGGASNLAVPTAPTTGTATTGGTVAANTYYAVICYLDAGGNPGPKSAQTSQVTTGATSTLTVTSPAASAGAVSYAVWWTVTNGGPYWPSPGTAVAIGTNSTRTTTPATSGTQPPGTDYSQRDAAQIAYTDAVVQATTTTALSVLNPFTPAMVGNVFNVTSGGTVQRAQITAVSAAALATFDKSLGTAAQVCVGNLGGALQSLTAAAGLVVAGNAVYIKAGTYSETLTIATSGSTSAPIQWIGFNATRGDNPTDTTRPFIDGAGARANCIDEGTFTGNVFWFLRMATATGSNVTQAANGVSTFVACKSSDATANGFAMSAASTMTLILCESSGNTATGVSASGNGTLLLYYCYIHDNITNGVNATSTSNALTMYGNIVEANSATNVVFSSNSRLIASGNTIDGASGGSSDGMAIPGFNSFVHVIMSNGFTNNGRYGLNRGTAGGPGNIYLADYNGYSGNATAAYNGVAPGAHDVTTSPGYVDAASGNFAIGTAWKALGFPGVFPGGLSTGYMDIGAVQRQEAGAGGVMYYPGMGGGVES